MTPTHSVSGTSPLRKATTALTSGLKEYFESTCPSRHNLRIPVENVESEVGTGTAECTLHLGLPGDLVAQARAGMHYTRGNVFDVAITLKEVSLEGERVLDNKYIEHFSLCIAPDSSTTIASSVGTHVGEALLADIKDLVGTYVLQFPTALGGS